MHAVPADLDLNLLRTLDVLLRERSVTRAARVLGRSQPAVSHALARLREVLGDPLLVREGADLVPTRRGEALAAPVRQALEELGRALHAGDFDPRTATRTFTLACPDVLAPLLPDLMAALADAPGVSLQIVAGRGLDAVDHADVVVDALPGEAPGVEARVVGATLEVVTMRRDHPAARGPWTLGAWAAWPHLVVSAPGPSRIEQALADAGHPRRVGMTVPSLLLVPHVVARTDLFFTGALQLLRPFSEPLGLVFRPALLPLPSVRAAAMWRTRHRADPGHRWFRERIIDAVKAAMEVEDGRIGQGAPGSPMA